MGLRGLIPASALILRASTPSGADDAGGRGTDSGRARNANLTSGIIRAASRYGQILPANSSLGFEFPAFSGLVQGESELPKRIERCAHA